MTKTMQKMEDLEEMVSGKKELKKTKKDFNKNYSNPVEIRAKDANGNNFIYIGQIMDIKFHHTYIRAKFQIDKVRSKLIVHNDDVKEKITKEWSASQLPYIYQEIPILNQEEYEEFIHHRLYGFKEYILYKLNKKNKVTLSDELLDNLFVPQIEKLLQQHPNSQIKLEKTKKNSTKKVYNIDELEKKIEFKRIRKTKPTNIITTDANKNKITYKAWFTKVGQFLISRSSVSGVAHFQKYITNQNEKEKQSWSVSLNVLNDNYIVYRGEIVNQNESGGFKNRIRNALLTKHNVKISPELIEQAFEPHVQQIISGSIGYNKDFNYKPKK